MVSAPPYLSETLPEVVWRQVREEHERRLRPVLDPYLARRSRGEKHPVMDFLFEYYSFRPGHLLRWSPGFGVALAGTPDEPHLNQPPFVPTPAGFTLDPALFPEHRTHGIAWIRTLLEKTEAHPPFLGCYGLHEWAMVYRTDTVRHGQVALRMEPEALAAFVEEQPIVCSHFDAFRFFTPEARPLNRHQPTHDTMPALEQPGCLHTNMDLYRWAFKLFPWVPGTLLADTFLLACRIREVDMRASPYDLRAFGLAPICIETPNGRREYQQYQRRFMHEATSLRTRLLTAYDNLLAWL